jgi:WD40 repeat protein
MRRPALSPKQRGQRFTHESGANQALFSPEGTLLMTTGFDYQLRIYHARRQQLVAPIMHRAALIQSVAFSPDGRFLAAGESKEWCKFGISPRLHVPYC